MIILTPFPALDSKQRLFTKEIGNDLQVLKNSRKVASLTRFWCCSRELSELIVLCHFDSVWHDESRSSSSYRGC